MCVMWMVSYNDGYHDSMYPSDEQLFELLKYDSRVSKVWERKTGKVLLDKGYEEPEERCMVKAVLNKAKSLIKGGTK